MGVSDDGGVDVAGFGRVFAADGDGFRNRPLKRTIEDEVRVDDATADRWPGLASNASAALAGWDPRAGPVVALAHQPRSAREVVGVWRGRRGAGGGGALVLSGHTHCGQIFPFQLPAWLGNPYFCG